ncbi:MAG: copper chaperone PCu(A)C [Hyphomicrobiaceae bacterium]
MLSETSSGTVAVQNRTNLRLLGSLLLLGSALVLWGQSSNAQHTHSVTLDKAHIVLGPPTIKVHGGYFELSNQTPERITITGARSKDYRRVEIHRSKVEGGIAIMEPVDSLTVEAGQSVKFEAGGLHLMLIEPNRVIAANMKVTLTLTLADKRKLLVPFTVTRRHGMAPKTAGHEHSKHAH